MNVEGRHDSNGNVAAVLPTDLAAIVDRHQGDCRGVSYVCYILRQLGTLTREPGGSPERGWRFSCTIDEGLLRKALERLDGYIEWYRDAAHPERRRGGWEVHEYLTGHPHDWNR